VLGEVSATVGRGARRHGPLRPAPPRRAERQPLHSRPARAGHAARRLALAAPGVVAVPLTRDGRRTPTRARGSGLDAPGMDDAVSAVTVVIPAWNEAKRFDADAALRFLEAHSDAELVLVNDGSTDGTAALFDELRARSPSRVHVLHLAANVGKGEAVRRGLLNAFDHGAELAAYLDADLAAPLDTAPLLA